jgi:FkbM family methyltransferase
MNPALVTRPLEAPLLISATNLRLIWSVCPTGVLHVGAHEAEEASSYQSNAWGPVTWVEANPDRARELAAKFAGDPTNSVVNAVAWDVTGERMTFFEASNGQSSSLLEFGSHATHHPEIKMVGETVVETLRLDEVDEVCRASFDLVVMDIQGAELNALRGLGACLSDVQWIYLEVNTEQVYKGVPQFSEVTEYCKSQGFVLLDCSITAAGWGDALFCRDDLVPRNVPLRRVIRRSISWVSPPLAALARKMSFSSPGSENSARATMVDRN